MNDDRWRTERSIEERSNTENVKTIRDEEMQRRKRKRK